MPKGRVKTIYGYIYGVLEEDGKIREVLGRGRTAEEAASDCIERQGELKGSLFPVDKTYNDVTNPTYYGGQRVISVDNKGIAGAFYKVKKQKPAMVKFSVTVTEKQHEAVKKLAAESGVSVSRWFMDAIDEASGDKLSRTEIKNRILELVNNLTDML